MERLVKTNPANAGWRRDLAVSYEKVGHLLAWQGNLPEAENAFSASLAKFTVKVMVFADVVTVHGRSPAMMPRRLHSVASVTGTSRPRPAWRVAWHVTWNVT
jgi:hypothetical protein